MALISAPAGPVRMIKIALAGEVTHRGCNMSESLSLEDFIKTNKRTFNSQQTQTNRVLRLNTEIDLVNKHTELYVTGQVPLENFMTLQDIKNYLMQIKNNPYNMVPGEANAKICSDMKKLCISGIRIKDVKHRLVAKSLGINRVAYFNVQLARDLIHAERDKKKQAAMNARLDKILSYENREGYQPL